MLIITLPYLITVFMQGKKACPLRREISMEEYVAAVTASQISWNYSKEAIKAQTVIARTNLYLKWREKKAEEMLQTAQEVIKKKKMNDKALRKFQTFQEAAKETQGEVLKWNQEVKEVPYHVLSAGKTRNGKEILGESFTYILSAKVPKDEENPVYLQGCYFTAKELEQRIRKKYEGFSFKKEQQTEIKRRDSANYVLEIQIGNQVFQGEEVKELLELPSSCFTVQQSETQIRFLCRGIGHGVGMSQYSAQQMALQDKNYREILHFFYPEMQIEIY